MYDIAKRFIDILVSLSLLFCLAPLFLLIMLILRCSGEGEVFYLQRRIGLGNRYFHIFKFATMVKNSLHMGTGSITLRDDPRVTKVGKYLRMTKLNELPQLLNVLLGDMSLVGPRPFVDQTFQTYPIHVQQRVYNRKPGLTGIGSIVYRDEEAMISRSELPPDVFYRETISPHKGELELWYQDRCSLWLDFQILCVTVITVLLPNSGNLVYRVFSGLPRPQSDQAAARRVPAAS